MVSCFIVRNVLWTRTCLWVLQLEVPLETAIHTTPVYCMGFLDYRHECECWHNLDALREVWDPLRGHTAFAVVLIVMDDWNPSVGLSAAHGSLFCLLDQGSASYGPWSKPISSSVFSSKFMGTQPRAFIYVLAVEPWSMTLCILVNLGECSLWPLTYFAVIECSVL